MKIMIKEILNKLNKIYNKLLIINFIIMNIQNVIFLKIIVSFLTNAW